MSSRKRRTTTNSGKSEKSTTKATSTQPKNSLPTATASFETVFGNAEPKELMELKAQRARFRAVLDELQKAPEPRLALLRVRRGQRMSRLRSQLKMLDEAIASMTISRQA